jgi:hypothetical protein
MAEGHPDVRVAVHIGFHKTATTWLQQEILPRHPEVRSFVDGSPHGSPFLVEIIGRSDRRFDPVVARAAFDARVAELAVPAGGTVVVSAERLSGHAATGGFDTVRIARRLHAVVPEARVFFAVREQVAMIESEYRQLLLEGSPRRLGSLLHTRPSWARVEFDLEHYEYDLLADEYARCFGADRVLVESFEAINRDQAAYLARLAGFLEIAPWQLPDGVLARRVNRGASTRLLGVRRGLNGFTRSHLQPDPPVALPGGWRRPLAAVAARLPARRAPLIDESERARLREHYAASNARLTERYGVTFG